MLNENRLPVDEVEVEGTFSGALKEPSSFKLLLSSVLSSPGSLVTNSVAPVATDVKLKPSGLASDDRPSFGTDGSLRTGEENANGATLSPVLLLKWNVWEVPFSSFGKATFSLELNI